MHQVMNANPVDRLIAENRDGPTHSAIESFFVEIRTNPKYVAAAADNPAVRGKIRHVEMVLRAAHQLGEEDANAQRVFDRIVAVIDDRSLSLKERLLKVSEFSEDYQRIADDARRVAADARAWMREHGGDVAH